MTEWRYVATRLNGDGTESFLTSDIPLSSPRILDTLSAPPLISGTLKPEIAGLKDYFGRPIFEPYSTAIYAQADGQIHTGGIVTRVALNDSEAEIEISGFLDYPRGQGWTDAPGIFYEEDPAVLFRYAWGKLQAHPGANLGLRFQQTTTPVRVGKRAVPEDKDKSGGTSDEPLVFARYSTTDLGKDLDDLLSAASVEVREVHSWGTGATLIDHYVEMSYPRRGRRADARYVIGENVLSVPGVTPNADLYASEVIVIGAGEGPAALVETAQTPVLKRLRRAVALSRTDLANSQLVAGYASQQLKRREVIRDDIDEIIVRDTPYSPLVAIRPGDEIMVSGEAGWAGYLNAPVRVISVEYTPEDSSSAKLRVVPTDRA